MIKVGTLFSGGLAACEFSLKYLNIDHEVTFACEWDKYAREQYLHFHGEHGTFYNDVSDMDGTPYKNKIDLMVWGSPCQDLSLVGKRKGFDGEKSSLFREGARIMSEVMPKCFIFENVKGLLSSNGGADYKEVIKTFQEMGYLITSSVLNTKDFEVPQNRERVFIVGFLDENQYHSFTFPEPKPLLKRLRDVFESDVDEKYYLSQKMIDGFTGGKKDFHKNGLGFKFDTKNNNSIANCLDCKEGNRVHNNYIEIKSATKKGYETATNEDSINFTHPDIKTRRGRVGKGVAQTLDCACNQGVIEPMIYDDYNDNLKTDGVACTLTCNSGASAPRNGQKVIEPFERSWRIRRLTPKECFRLQGVKDEDIDLVVSDTQGYKIAGNAITVNVMMAIIDNIVNPKSNGGLF